MEDFSLNNEIEETDDDSLQMSVSSVCEKDGKKIAYVSFVDARRSAEGIIPDCKIVNNKGFTVEEVSQLEDYMKKELSVLKRMASRINLLDAFMEKKREDII